MNAPKDQLILSDFEKWAYPAREFAEKREHWIDARVGETPQMYAEVLRHKIRVDGWKTALTCWYSVDIGPDNRAYKHFSMQTSQTDLAQVDAEMLQMQINEYKDGLLEFFEPMVKVFWPLAEELHTKFDIGQPIPVKNPRNGLVTLRVPMTFHFLLPIDGEVEPAKVRNIVTTQPQFLGWKKPSSIPEDDSEVLAYWIVDKHYDIIWFDDGAWRQRDCDLEIATPDWWKPLPPLC